MHKFIIKRNSNLVDTNINSFTTSLSPSQSSISGNKRKINIETKKLSKRRKYNDDYLNFEFTFIGDESNQVPQCIVCGLTLSNESMVLNKLKRHLEQNHSHVSKKSSDYFMRLMSSQKKIQHSWKNV